MTDYNLYRQSKGLSNNDIINVVRTNYPRFSKAQMSFISHPDKYGVCLLPEAEHVLVERFGDGEGLTVTVNEYEGKHLQTKAKKKAPNRTKPFRYTVRLTPEFNARVQEFVQTSEYKSMQDLIEAALSFYIEQHTVGRE